MVGMCGRNATDAFKGKHLLSYIRMAVDAGSIDVLGSVTGARAVCCEARCSLVCIELMLHFARDVTDCLWRLLLPAD